MPPGSADAIDAPAMNREFHAWLLENRGLVKIATSPAELSKDAPPPSAAAAWRLVENSAAAD